MTDSSYASSPEMPHRIPNPHRFNLASKAITASASGGFRLSLALNAVGAESALRHEMASADIEVQVIAKRISDFSLRLKQVGRIMEENRTIASPSAIETVAEIKDQADKDFEEIKSMTGMIQRRDEDGYFRGIEVAQKVTWAFKKRKMQYLLGQLEYLKDSLGIMLQTLQLGRELASAYEGKSKPPSHKDIEQERAEIQNMIIVQHYSMVELAKLYDMAEQEATAEIDSPGAESPPPTYHPDPPGNHLTLTIGAPEEKPPERPPKEVDNSRALVTYQERERPLAVIKDDCERVMDREEEALGAPVHDIVDHLLDKWTQVGVPAYYQNHRRHSDPRPKQRNRRMNRHAQVESDESDTSEYESDFERSENIGGYYIEGPRNAPKKSVRFRGPTVAEAEDEEFQRPKKTTKQHVLRPVSESSSESEVETHPMPPPSGQHRRTSTSSNGSHGANQSERQRRPYSRNSQQDQAPRPGTRNIVPPPPMGGQYPPQQQQSGRPMPMPMPMTGMGQHPSWQGQPYPVPPPGGLRPPSQSGPPPRTGTNGNVYGAPPYMIPSPGASPQTPQGSYFPTAPRGGPGYPTMTAPPPPPPPLQHGYSSTSNGRHGGSGSSKHHNHYNSNHNRAPSSRRNSSSAKKKDESTTSKNVKKGILGGTAIAGVMEILQGLDGL